MMNNRDAFYSEISRGLIGPGSDVFGVADETELISDYPLNRYHSAILFPQKIYSGGDSNPVTQLELDEKDGAANANDQNYIADEEEVNLSSEQSEDGALDNQEAEIASHDFEQSQNTFFPTHMGLTFCVAEGAENVEVSFCFGLYLQLSHPDQKIKVAISKKGFDSFFEQDIEAHLSFTDALVYADGFMSLNRALRGNIARGRSEDYASFDAFKKYGNIGKKEAYRHVHLLERLMGRIWSRRQIEVKQTIKVTDSATQVTLFEESLDKTGKEKISASYRVKFFTHGNQRFLKILLINSSIHAADQFANTNDRLNPKCLFQSQIIVENAKLVPYKSQGDIHPFDDEQNEINFIYRDVKSYGVGHNCSVQWQGVRNGNPMGLETSFMPEQIAFGMKNDFADEDFDNATDNNRLNETLELRKLSRFNDDDVTIISGLTHLVLLYGEWIAKQKKQAAGFSGNDKDTAAKITQRQEKTLARLMAGVSLLRENERAMRCFKLANTAMLIQMIIGGDERFGKTERHLTDEVEEVDYKSLSFFESYEDWQRLNDKGAPPRYRPFQLAFFLLSLEGIVSNESEDRSLVDLIWFPTGGGKTEAYLAVSAFTILWRRLNNSAEQAKGTSIMMRYTLRLLTSQQFERASRLILALEFLRRNLDEELHEEPISIGLWVGQGASPNVIAEADELYQKIQANPEQAAQHNSKLQLSACPWCGTKLVSKKANNRWDYGYESRTGANAYFRFRCINRGCAFYRGLPIQVVDEMLYEQPPTLLFATVDKFAVLASKEGAHCFFNQFSTALPPDLVIQDELHLISGPLGSIVGIFESVVEYLCTKDGRRPKIISSTATTRNTGPQIHELYGGRVVDIFPPSGISYDDSFFARETASKRKYTAFMPTGKTSLSTQLWVLVHLLLTRVRLYQQGNLTALDLYWTFVSYYNSLRDVGKIYNKVNDEIQTNLNALFYRFFGNNDELRFLISNVPSRTDELTSRLESENIKAQLKRLEHPFSVTQSEKGTKYLKDVVDLVLASNMISVGIDVSRLNLMLINGMPRNIAEYIQASSRVGRKYDGLVITLHNASQARDKSYFENFGAFHQAYYKFVEPLSVTPFTENTIHKMACTMMAAFLRNAFPELNRDSDAKNFRQEHAEVFKRHVHQHFQQADGYFDELIDELSTDWTSKIQRGNGVLTYTRLLKRPSTNTNPAEEQWLVMNSLRDIDSETYFRIDEVR